MGIKKLLSVATFLVAGSLAHTAWAQTDVTSTYLKNADFSQGTPVSVGVCTYDYDMEKNGTEYCQLVPVEGWNIAENGNARAGGLFAFGSGAWLGGKGYNAPATNSDGETTGNILGVIGVWNQVAQYTQNVTLPADTYTLVVPVYNSVGGTTAVEKNLIGFIADGGTEYLSSTKNYPVNTWKYDFITFTLSEETTGKISLGFDAPDVGSGGNQHLFISAISLFSGEVDAEAYAAAKEAERNAKELALNKAKLEGSCYMTPSADLLVNGSFDTANHGWTLTNMSYQQNGERPTRYAEKWNKEAISGSGSATQTIKNLPAGAYYLTAVVNAQLQSNQSLEITGVTLKVNDETKNISGPWKDYEILYNHENDGDVTVTFTFNGTNANWVCVDQFSLVYGGDYETYISDKEVLQYKKPWSDALATATAAINDAKYANVTGVEKTALQAEIAKAEPTTADGYIAATTALDEATSAFTAAKTNYDNLVAEIAKAKALGITDADDYAATEAYTSATALESTQALKVAEYNYVAENYEYPVELGNWITEGPTGSLTAQHYSGENKPYLEQSGAAWGQNSWTIKYSQDLSLPAGDYVFKVAGRRAAGSGNTLNLNVSIKDGDSLGEVTDFPEGDSGLGINKAGVTSFDPADEAGFAFEGAGRGWEWRYVKFTLTEDAVVTVAVNANATTIHQWVSFCDATVQTNNEANIAMIAYNIAKNDANLALKNDTYSVVTGSERTELTTAINAETGSDAASIAEATESLKTATKAFTDAKASYDDLNAAKKEISVELPYASVEKYAALTTAVEAVPTSAEDAATKAAAIRTANRLYVESNAMAEGVVGAEQINVLDPCMEVTYNAENKKFGAWQVFGQTDGNIQLLTGESFTDAAGKNDYKYADIYKTDNNAGIKQTVNLKPGKYILTVTARAATTAEAAFRLFAGTATTDISRIGNTGGVFGRGWNDVTLEFTVSETSDVEIGVQSFNGRDIWWSATRFRLVKIAEAANMSISEAQYGTFVAPFEVEIPEGVTASKITGIDANGYTVVEEVLEGTIPANTPVILFSEAVVNTTFYGTAVEGTAKAGLLTGNLSGETINAPMDSYILLNGENGVGFYRVVTEDVTVNNNRVYLTVPAVAEAKAFISFGDATSINGVTEGATEVVRYNAAGVKVNAPVKGLNIVKMSDGTVKKVMVK